jgi:hypothetical protein
MVLSSLACPSGKQMLSQVSWASNAKKAGRGRQSLQRKSYLLVDYQTTVVKHSQLTQMGRESQRAESETNRSAQRAVVLWVVNFFLQFSQGVTIFLQFDFGNHSSALPFSLQTLCTTSRT